MCDSQKGAFSTLNAVSWVVYWYKPNYKHKNILYVPVISFLRPFFSFLRGHFHWKNSREKLWRGTKVSQDKGQQRQRVWCSKWHSGSKRLTTNARSGLIRLQDLTYFHLWSEFLSYSPDLTFSCFSCQNVIYFYR